MFVALLKGFVTSGSLIVAIGAQNAFVIRQGLLQRHLLLTALVCSAIDALLITSGILGFGHIISSFPLVVEAAQYFSIVFLLAYGAISLRSAFKYKSLDLSEHTPLPSIKKTILLLLGFSLLNPHVYLDTVILLGSIAVQQPAHTQTYFTLGAIGASFTWFFALTYGSRFLAPFFSKQNSWKIIDSLIAITMWAIALTLLIKSQSMVFI
jgi:L-lysine exporter family protein LysE/ArgO